MPPVDPNAGNEPGRERREPGRFQRRAQARRQLAQESWRDFFLSLGVQILIVLAFVALLYLLLRLMGRL